MKIVFISILLMCACRVSAETYDPLLLRAQASIFPKIILLDQDLNKKTPDDKVVLTIVSTSRDELAAERLRKLIEDKYGISLGNKSLNVNVITYEDFNQNSLSTAYIVFPGDESLIDKVVAHASSHGRVVFSYSYADFGHDALISLYVKEKTYVYLNKSAIQLYDIKFFPVFYKIARVLE